MTLTKLQKQKTALRSLENEFDSAVHEFVNSQPQLEGERFWLYIDEIRANARSYIAQRTKLTKPNMTVASEAIQSATEECGRRAKLAINGFSMTEFIQFVNRFDEIKYNLYDEHLHNDNIDLQRSDDGFGDFCDLVTLAGETIVEKILNDKYRNAQALYRDLKKYCEPWLYQLICDGEAYVSMFLFNSIKTYI